MTKTPDELLARLKDLGVEATTHRHPPVYTVEESKRLRGELPGAHCKNLFLKDKGGALYLVVTLENTSVDLKQLKKRISSKHLSFGKPALLQEVLGIEPGAVSPFALINDTDLRVKVVLDEALLKKDPLNFHPLDNSATTAVAPKGLLTFIAECGHEPLIVDLNS